MKAVHKIWRPAAAVFVAAGLVGTAAFAARQSPTTLHKVSKNADGAVPATAAVGPGVNYTTGFEPGEGFVARDPAFVAPATRVAPPAVPFSGYIDNQPCAVGPTCWGVTGSGSRSLWEAHVDVVHPKTGTQHLRMSFDATTLTNRPGFGLGVDARLPSSADATPQPIAPNTVSAQISITNPGGMDYRFQPQSNSQGFLATSTLFYFAGGIYILDDVCGTTALGFAPTGVNWDATGGYQNITVDMDPCTNVINYSYGGALIYTSCTYAGTNLEQFLIFGDNYTGSSVDIDDLVMTTGTPPPSVCGNGIIDGCSAEQCEPGVIACNPGHTCNPADCTCSRICTFAEPCVLQNGENGPFVGPFDSAFGGIFVYEAGGVEAVSIELCGSTGIDTFISYWGSCEDPADAGSSNDDCCDPADTANCGSFGNGSDPTASCYNNLTANYESCTCHDNPLAGDSCYLLQTNGGNDTDVSLLITVNKKAVCGGPHVGSCCDTNGADTGCTENVLAANCVGADKVWTENGKCPGTCVCIPICAGVTCGDDGCGGNCPDLCSDGLACNGVETCNFTTEVCGTGTPIVCTDNNVCNGLETCRNPDGACLPGSLLVCNDGLFCNGEEDCNPSSGCFDNPDPCDPDRDSCNEGLNVCEPLPIPTVSEWGIAVLTLLLLIGAKVYFGRRQVTA